MSDEVARQAAEARAERDSILEETETLKRAVQRMTLELVAVTTKHSEAVRDCERIERFYAAVRADLQQAKNNNAGLLEQIQNLLEQLAEITAERDLVRENLCREERKAKVMTKKRDAAQAEVERLTVERNQWRQDADGMELRELQDRHAVLQAALKRAEAALAAAQDNHIDPLLKGFLAIISQTADQAQRMLP